MINLIFIFEVPSSDVCWILKCVSICILYSCFTFSFYLAWHCVGLEYREGQKMLTYCFPTEFIGMQRWCLSLVSKSKNMYFMPSVKMHNLSITILLFMNYIWILGNLYLAQYLPVVLPNYYWFVLHLGENSPRHLVVIIPLYDCTCWHSTDWKQHFDENKQFKDVCTAVLSTLQEEICIGI